MNKRTIKQKRNKHLLMAVSLFCALVSSCVNDVAYNKSVDIHQQGWMPTDTIFFNLNVADTISFQETNTLKRNDLYRLSLSVRYSSVFPFCELPINIRVEEKGYKLRPTLSRKSSWGSLFQDVISIDNITVAFPDTGFHTIAIYPDTIFRGIYSVGIELSK